MRAPYPYNYNADRARNHGQEQRQRIAVEAARLMTEHGIRDFRLAKRKAAERLGISDELNLPKNSEVETALREYQRLFRADAQPQILKQRRTIALQAMQFFKRFDPRLVGAVLEGTADRHSAVCLHLFSDDPAALPIFLHEQGIPFEEESRQLRLTHDKIVEFPVYLFSADDTAMDLTLLPLDQMRQAPLNNIDGSAMRRAAIAAVQKLVDGDSDAGAA